MIINLKDGRINKRETVLFPTTVCVEYYIIYYLDNYYIRLQFNIFDIEELSTIDKKELLFIALATTISEEDFAIIAYNFFGASSYYSEFRPKGES